MIFQQQNCADTRALRVDIILLPNFTLTALSLFLDPIRLAADDMDRSRQRRCRWRVTTLNGLPVRSSCGVEVQPTARLKNCDDPQWLVVVGGLMETPWREDERLVDLLVDADRRDIRIAGLCTGVFPMAAAGILDGEICCVSWLHRDEFVAAFDLVEADTSALYHVGERHTTCAGGIGVAHLSLDIIRQNLGSDVARKCAQILMLPPHWESNREQPVQLAFGHVSPKVRAALKYMETCIEAPPGIDEVATRVSISCRHLERLFKRDLAITPQKAMQMMQLDKARRYVQETDLSMIEIAFGCGFQSPSHFSAVFKRAYSSTPSVFRKASLTEWALSD